MLMVMTFTGCGEGAGSGVGATLNAFTRGGSPLSIDALVANVGITSSDIAIPAATSQIYYGRALIKNGGTLYGMTFRFTLNKQSDSAAFFSNFQILRLVLLNGFANAAPLLTGTTTISVPSGYNAGTNGLSLVDLVARTARFNLNFGANAYLPQITSAGIIVSSDFRTIVGGDDGAFFFIAQKATGLESSTSQDLIAPFSLVEFGVNSAGSLTLSNFWSFSGIVGLGGGGYPPFRMTTSEGAVKEGEFQLVDSSSGVFVWGFDATAGDGSPTATSGLEGVILLSPDRQLLLAYDLANFTYWAGSRQ